MKKFLAVFLGKEESMSSWNALSDSERKAREAKGIAAWHAWVGAHKKSILVEGSPLGRTMRVNKAGVASGKNDLCGYTVVEAESHEAAAKMFLEHPHFSIFPGDSVEVLECMEIPGM